MHRDGDTIQNIAKKKKKKAGRITMVDPEVISSKTKK